MPGGHHYPHEMAKKKKTLNYRGTATLILVFNRSGRYLYHFFFNSRVLGQQGIRTAMRSSKIKWSIMKGVKDKQKEEEILGVVYAIGCGDCRKVYIGETRRMAAQRVKEHKSDTRLGHSDKSAVVQHAHTTGHNAYRRAMVVEWEQHERNRKVKEALHIHRMTRKDGSMNQDRGLHLSKISWPAMRVISLGIRTVPVLSVAKKLAAPRPTPTAPAAKCGLIRQDEAD